MDLATIIDGVDRFVAYVEELTSVIGHADRALPLREKGRKSVEPMAAVTAPARVRSSCISLAKERSAESVLAKALAMPAIERHGPIKAWIIDDTSYPKQGTFGRHAIRREGRG